MHVGRRDAKEVNVGCRQPFFGPPVRWAARMHRLAVVLLVALFASSAYANRGLIVVGPPEIRLEESAQNAIVAWNGSEEVIVLSSDVSSSQSAWVLEVLPLPANPSKVELGSFDSFTQLKAILDERLEKAWDANSWYQDGGRGVEAPKEIEITFHEKLGVHDVTVVRVSSSSHFIEWVRDFLATRGLSRGALGDRFETAVKGYLDRGLNFFVFDVIEVGSQVRSVDPIIYRFKTPRLFYPLEITGASDVGDSRARLGLFLITAGAADAAAVGAARLWPGAGFGRPIGLSRRELGEICPEVAALFSGGAFVAHCFYAGRLNWLDKDLVLSQQDVRVPAIPTAVLPQVPESYVLLQNSPNPFNLSTVITYGLPSRSEVRVAVHDVLGREVAVVDEGAREAGYHSAIWDGRTDSGNPVATGIYLYKIQAGPFVQCRRMALVK